jgi:hypothetical protein
MMGAHIVTCDFGPARPNLAPTAGELAVMQRETDLYRSALQPLVDKGVLVVTSAGG